MALTFLQNKHLTMPAPRNLRAFRPTDIGVFPYGMPTYLAFFPDCARHLLEK
jgi:hypothetical protein